MSVKGSEQYQSTVVRHRPSQRWLKLSLLLLLLSLIVVASIWVGNQWLGKRYQQVVAERNQLQAQLLERDQLLDSNRQQLVNLQVGSQVDRQTVEQVRQLLREEEQKIAELTEEIRFYKGLMAPTDLESGLGVRNWELLAGSAPRVFQYKLLVQQLAVKHAVLHGTALVNIVGLLHGDAASYNLAELSSELTTNKITLRFKYFQSIEGELTLPEGFQPQRVEVVARARSPKKVQVQKAYDWRVLGES